ADVVAHIPAQSDAATQELVEQLTGFLFKTSYKSYALAIGASPDTPGPNLDVSVSTGQLAQWFGLQHSGPGVASRIVSAALWIVMLVVIIALVRTRKPKWLIYGALCSGLLFLAGYA